MAIRAPDGANNALFFDSTIDKNEYSPTPVWDSSSSTRWTPSLVSESAAASPVYNVFFTRHNEETNHSRKFVSKQDPFLMIMIHLHSAPFLPNHWRRGVPLITWHFYLKIFCMWSFFFYQRYITTIPKYEWHLCRWQRIVVWAVHQDIPKNIDLLTTLTDTPDHFHRQKTLSLILKHETHLAENSCVSSEPGYPPKYWPRGVTDHPPSKQGVSFHTYRTITKLPYCIIFCLFEIAPKIDIPLFYILLVILYKKSVYKNCFDPICKCGTKSKDFIKVHNYFWGIVHNFLGGKFKQLRWITAFAAV